MTVNLWSQTAATNATIDPSINWRENQAASTVNNSSRAMMAATAKWRDDQSGNILTGGSSTAYTITSNQGLTPLADGYAIRARMHATNGASPTLNVDSTGAKAIRVYTSTALPDSAVNAGSVHRFTYDSGDDCWYIGEFFTTTTLALTGLQINGATAVTTPAVDDEVGIYDLSATANRKITLANFFKTITALTAETDPATADELALYDASAATADKITIANLFKVINALTEDTTPNKAADYLATYDASASAAKKVLLTNLIVPGALIAIIQDQKAQNTDGGTFTSGADRTRTLNTLVYNRDSTVSLGSNQFTLPAGSWEIEWSVPGYQVDSHQSLLYDVTGGATLTRGTSEFNELAESDSTQTRSVGSYRHAPSSSNVYEIRHTCQTSRSTDGFGTAADLGTEVYTHVTIRAG